MEASIPYKTCSKCKQEFPATNEYFNRDKRKPLGLGYQCKECTKAYQREYNDRPETKAMKYEYNHQPDRLEYEQIRRATPEYIEYEKARKTSQHYREKQKELDVARRSTEAYQEYIKEYRSRPEVKAKHREHSRIHAQKPEVKEHTRLYYQTPAGKAARRAANNNRRVNGGKRLSQKTILTVYGTSKGICWWCGKAVGDNYHIDHRIAVSRGGDNGLGNLVVSCTSCNQSKYNKMPWEWTDRLL